MLGGRDIHFHAAHRIGRDRRGLVGIAMMAAAAGMTGRSCATGMAGLGRAYPVCMIVIGHQNSPGLLNYIPQGGI
jgi:hypothetical protein